MKICESRHQFKVSNKNPIETTNLPCANVLTDLNAADNAIVLNWRSVHSRELLPTPIQVSPNFPHGRRINETVIFSPSGRFDTSEDCVYPATDIAQLQWRGSCVHQSNVDDVGGWIGSTKIIST
jgi:hypothetical protein